MAKVVHKQWKPESNGVRYVKFPFETINSLPFWFATEAPTPTGHRVSRISSSQVAGINFIGAGESVACHTWFGTPSPAASKEIKSQPTCDPSVADRGIN